MATQIFQGYFEFIQREDKTVNGVSAEFAQENPDFEKQNETNKGCWNCSDCSGCSRCSRCSYLTNAAPVSSAKAPEGTRYPVIENIHQKVLEAVSAPNVLDMQSWHTCDTTHCRAGWVVFMAGEEGRKLEQKTTTAFAAMMIYKASSEIRVSPTRFYESNDVAMADIKRCADLEVQSQTQNQ
ncbi:MAG: hypothetical protein J7619_11895 [Dyadobacter sp.]|uniref:hypothetical protein n=1 Tax=Dyadobacter sp. TaxID=1914288 RepID=UPI001B0B75C6|nr:hypothetical protein [Dyadobacter sp.]MBO9613394.1 hypothetical protein [Dyadobacter sp.]